MTKFALLVGINYTGTRHALRGCINDVHTIKGYLQGARGYLEKDIVLITDDSQESLIPTKENIMRELSKLILKAQASQAEELWFHFSGHGTSMKDRNGDEDDGRDEVLVPIDFYKSGMIRDDLLNDYLKFLPAGCKMYCIMDCCHSGTILDLKYQYQGNNTNSTENPDADLEGDIVMISGSTDAQTSADSKINGKWAGAMTSSFMECIKNDITCVDLLSKMRDYLIKNGYSQVPQLSCSRPVSETMKW